MSKLTAKKVENALPRKKEYKLHDGEGLFLRIRPSRAKSWLFSFSLPGDRRLIRMTLSSIDRISLIEYNPARMLKPKDFAATASRSRDRVLFLPELRTLWSTLDQATEERAGLARTSTLSIMTAAAIKLLIFTGARRGEVAGMRWDELNIETRTWILPSSRTKNRQQHLIHLGEPAFSLIETLKPLTGSTPFVFNTGRNTGHIHTDSLTTAINRLKKSEPLNELKPFTIHDLRRSAATCWGEYLKTSPHVIERMLNHQPLNKLVSVYQRATYSAEQKATWLAWGEMIEHQVAHDSANVIPMSWVANNK